MKESGGRSGENNIINIKKKIGGSGASVKNKKRSI
jgi:hypothetical protein